MKKTIETRELIVLDDGDAVIRGTYHRTHDANSGVQSTAAKGDCIGVVFLNSLSPTRASTGDSAVYWADSFAKCGYQSFRLDMPGFGDSDGDHPTELLSFINTGGYASLVSAKVDELTARFGLSGVVIVGLCAGAVSALYAASASRQCKGLVLMDPYFFLPLAGRPTLWQKATNRISRSVLGRLLGGIYDQLSDFCVTLFRPGPPSNANFALLNCWKRVAQAGLPILVFQAPHSTLNLGGFNYRSYLLELAGPNSQVVIQDIKNTDHSFSDRIGRAAVRLHTEGWLSIFFPRAKCRDVAQNITSRELPAPRVFDLECKNQKYEDSIRNHDSIHPGCQGTRDALVVADR